MSVFSWAHPTPLSIRRRIRADQRVVLVSDLHLGDGTHSDTFLRKDREFLSFLRKVRADGAHLVIAGDAVDFHQAWFITRILRAHAEVIGEISKIAAEQGVTYIWGNHDHDISMFRDILRWDVCSTLEIGDRVIVRHGYEYDPYIGPNLDQSHFFTRVHHSLERLLETWMRLPLEHFYSWPNRASFWCFHKAGLLMRLWGQLNAALGHPEVGRRQEEFLKFWTQAQLGDPQCIFEAIRASLERGDADWIITGHSHLPGVVEVAQGRRYANTGSWTFGNSQYAVWDGNQVTVRDWISGKTYDDRLYQPLMDRRFKHMGFEEWWRENYLGWLRYRGGVDRVPLKLEGG